VKTVPDTGSNSSFAFGGSGTPVFGVHALNPTNRVCDGDSFFRMQLGFTPVPVGAMNAAVGNGVVFTKDTGPPFPR
jgi:hypothetical protein